MDFGDTDFSALGFDSILYDIIDGTFWNGLPMLIQNCIPKQLQVSTKLQLPPIPLATPLHNGNKKQHLNGDPTPWVNPRGAVEVNDNIFSAWKLLPGENYAGTIV